MGNIFSGQEKDKIGSKLLESDRVFPLGDNDKLALIVAKFHLDAKHVIEFHNIFRKMDKLGSGYINQENLFEFLGEELTSSLSPYIQRLFTLTEKETNDRISFVEWLPAISVYCLYPTERIISFVFSMIDDDHDQTISKKDIIKFLVKEHYGQKIFPFNYVKAIEILDVQRSDKITFEQFKRIQSKISFLCYPAFRLQTALRTKILGTQFWERAYFKIKEQESKEQKQLQADKIVDEIKKKQNLKIENKASAFDKYFETREISTNLIVPQLMRTRQPKRRGSDGEIGLDIGNLLEINANVQKNKKRSNSFIYEKPAVIRSKKQRVQSDDELGLKNSSENGPLYQQQHLMKLKLKKNLFHKYMSKKQYKATPQNSSRKNRVKSPKTPFQSSYLHDD